MAKTQPTNQSYLNPPHGPGKLTGGGANDVINPDPAGVAGGANDIYLPENQKIAGGANTNIYLNDNETV